MTTSPPYSLEGKTPEDLPGEPVEDPLTYRYEVMNVSQHGVTRPVDLFDTRHEAVGRAATLRGEYLIIPRERLKTDCECDMPRDRAYPDEGEFDPTCLSWYDKWDLWQCRSCGAVWWNHNARADYGDPRL